MEVNMKKIAGLSLERYPEDYLDSHSHRENRKFEIADTLEAVKQQMDIIDSKIVRFDIPKIMSDGQFLSAGDKQKILKQWKTFVHTGFQPEKFTKSIYNHLHLHCGFIAHYDRSGFYYTYWNDEVVRFSEKKGYETVPAPKTFFEWERFLKAFSIWGEYADINLAMMVVLWDELRMLKDRLMSEAKEIYKYEITNAHACMDREREVLEEEVLSLQSEMQEKRGQLSRLTAETYMQQIHSDYRDLFGDDFVEDDQPQQMTIAV
jgi:hypothetical protein